MALAGDLLILQGTVLGNLIQKQVDPGLLSCQRVSLLRAGGADRDL